MSKKSKSKEKQMKAQAEQFKYKGMTKAQIQKAKKEERAVWVFAQDLRCLMIRERKMIKKN